MKYKYAAVVVLYQPDDKVKKNIISYIDDIQHLYVVDNSFEKQNLQLIRWLNQKDKITYLDCQGNEGLAKALNIGCHNAIKDGYDYILTMDQDSFFEKNSVKELINYIESTPQEKVALVAPIVTGLTKDSTYIIDQKKDLVTRKNWVMTSGSMLDLDKYRLMGDFDEALFIGHIDIEYGIRIHENNLEIHQISKSHMFQQLGNAIEKRFLWKKVHLHRGALYRSYYHARNQYYVLHKYGKHYKKFTNVQMWKGLVKVIFYGDHKIQRLKMLYYGYLDGKKGRMGKSPYQNR